jgi:hypothetical protein
MPPPPKDADLTVEYLPASLPSEADSQMTSRTMEPTICSKLQMTLMSLLAMGLLQPGPLPAEPIAVRYREGSVHGFLALSTLEGKVIAAGDLTQVVRGNQVESRLVYRFKYGSIDDETAVFSQQHDFRLIRDHHIQKGPSFPHPTDVSINASTGQVTVRYTDKGHKKVETEHLDLRPDLANGVLLNMLKNIRPDSAETKVSYVAATPKPRLVQLSIASQGEDTFSIVGVRYKATLFVLKVELGGITGVIAPLVGKKPADTKVWVVAGGTPAFVKAEQSLYPGGPVWRIELASPVWQNAFSPPAFSPDGHWIADTSYEPREAEWLINHAGGRPPRPRMSFDVAPDGRPYLERRLSPIQ